MKEELVDIKKTNISQDDMNAVGNCVKLAYLFITLASNYIETASDILARNNMYIHETKYLSTKVLKSMEMYDSYMRKQFGMQGSESLVRHYEDIHNMITQYITMTEENWDWKHRYLYEVVKHNMTRKELDELKKSISNPKKE